MEQFLNYFTNTGDFNINKFGIEILNIGHVVTKAHDRYPDIIHPEKYYFDWNNGRSLSEFTIVYISKGEGIFEANGHTAQKLTAGTIILLFPGVWHRYKPNPATGWEEYWIGFGGLYADHLLKQQCFSPQNPLIQIGFNREFLLLFSNLVNEIEPKEENNDNIMPSFLVIQLLGIIYASVLIQNKQIGKKQELINHVLKIIHENWNQNHDLLALANSIKVSYAWFRKSFKEILGISPNQYIIMLRLRNAEQLILKTNKTISQISYECGFESEFYFSKLYKEKMGYNASELRKVDK